MKNLKLNSFRRDEGGSITAFLLTIFLLMVVSGGMAVDFMRHESERVIFQDVLDRAVLATASYSSVYQTEEEVREVILSHLTAAGYDTDYLDDLLIIPTITPDYRRVDVSANFKIRTFFLRIINKPTLMLAARATAQTSRGNLEVSLVVDVSYSMSLRPQICNDVSAGWEYYRDRWNNWRRRWVEAHENCVDNMAEPIKIDSLKTAATLFMNKMLATEDDILHTSISFVPFSGQVEPGKDIADQITGMNQWHQYSHCIDFDGVPDSSTNLHTPGNLAGDHHFTTTAMDPTDTYYQAETWNTGFTNSAGHRFCLNEANQIIPLSNDKDRLNQAIQNLEVEEWTAIWMGAKWGAALLDPSMRPVISGLIATPAEGGGSVVTPRFAGRPTNWNDQDYDSVKYLVLMTDGENTKYRTVDPDHYAVMGRDVSGNWRTQENADYWAGMQCDVNGQNCVQVSNTLDRKISDFGGATVNGLPGYNASDSNWNGYNDWVYTLDNEAGSGVHAGYADDRLHNLCEYAKVIENRYDGDGVLVENSEFPRMVIFTIGFDIDPGGPAAEAMLDCASNAQSFFLAFTAADLTLALNEIAATIHRLKLVAN